MRIDVYDIECCGIHDGNLQQDGFLYTGITGVYSCNFSGGRF